MNVFAHFVVWLYDLYLRIRMPSYYLYLDQFENIDAYYRSLDYSFRRYIFSSIKKFENQKKLFTSSDGIKRLNREIKNFIWKVFQQKHNPASFYYFYIIFYSIILKAGCAKIRMIRNTSKEIIGFYVFFPTRKVNYLLSALIDISDPSSRNCSYFYYINEMIELSFNQCISIVRLGPTADHLKIKLGGRVKRINSIFPKKVREGDANHVS